MVISWPTAPIIYKKLLQLRTLTPINFRRDLATPPALLHGPLKSPEKFVVFISPLNYAYCFVDEWLDEMHQVFFEVYRVTKPGGFCCIVIGNEIIEGKTKLPLPAKP